MHNKWGMETLDRTLRDLMSSLDPRLALLPFGGRVVAFGRDFRQVLPVVQRGSRTQVVVASLRASHLWL